MPDFIAYPKTPRLFRDVVVTEKIDGTNAAVQVDELGAVTAQSRRRIITPDDDNFGFARWAAEHAGVLADTLGPGVHFGEWWGSGIQRGYGLAEKRLSLFNASRWEAEDLSAVPGLGVVPVLARCTFGQDVIEDSVQRLRDEGSLAAPGFRPAEGIVVWHSASRQAYKVLLENDELPKGVAA